MMRGSIFFWITALSWSLPVQAMEERNPHIQGSEWGYPGGVPSYPYLPQPGQVPLMNLMPDSQFPVPAGPYAMPFNYPSYPFPYPLGYGEPLPKTKREAIQVEDIPVVLRLINPFIKYIKEDTRNLMLTREQSTTILSKEYLDQYSDLSSRLSLFSIEAINTIGDENQVSTFMIKFHNADKLLNLWRRSLRVYTAYKGGALNELYLESDSEKSSKSLSSPPSPFHPGWYPYSMPGARFMPQGAIAPTPYMGEAQQETIGEGLFDWQELPMMLAVMAPFTPYITKEKKTYIIAPAFKEVIWSEAFASQFNLMNEKAKLMKVEDVGCIGGNMSDTHFMLTVNDPDKFLNVWLESVRILREYLEKGGTKVWGNETLDKGSKNNGALKRKGGETENDDTADMEGKTLAKTNKEGKTDRPQSQEKTPAQQKVKKGSSNKARPASAEESESMQPALKKKRVSNEKKTRQMQNIRNNIVYINESSSQTEGRRKRLRRHADQQGSNSTSEGGNDRNRDGYSYRDDVSDLLLFEKNSGRAQGLSEESPDSRVDSDYHDTEVGEEEESDTTRGNQGAGRGTDSTLVDGSCLVFPAEFKKHHFGLLLIGKAIVDKGNITSNDGFKKALPIAFGIDDIARTSRDWLGIAYESIAALRSYVYRHQKSEGNLTKGTDDFYFSHNTSTHNYELVVEQDLNLFLAQLRDSYKAMKASVDKGSHIIVSRKGLNLNDTVEELEKTVVAKINKFAETFL